MRMSPAVPASSPQNRWLVAGGWGLAAALLARVVLLVVSAPHSTHFFRTPGWHFGVVASVGLLVWMAVFMRWRRPGRIAPFIAVGAFVLALLAHRLAFNVELVNGWMPDFWIE
jgi:hypothetical protein